MTNSRLFGLIVTMCFVFLIGGQYLSIRSQRNTINELKSQIAMLEEKSKVQEAQVELAHHQAEDKLNQVENESHRIMEIEVPQECEKAISWAVEQASILT